MSKTKNAKPYRVHVTNRFNAAESYKLGPYATTAEAIEIAKKVTVDFLKKSIDLVRSRSCQPQQLCEQIATIIRAPSHRLASSHDEPAPVSYEKLRQVPI